MSEADDRRVLATLARLKRVREMRSQIARVAAARQQRIAAQSRHALDAAHAQLARQLAAKAAIQTRLADDARDARTLQNAAADTRTFDRHIGAASASVNQAAHVHRGHEATLAELQRAARKAKAAEDKLERAGEKARHALAARVERDADEVADAYAVRRFAAPGVWAADAGRQPDASRDTHADAAAFDAAMTAQKPADAQAGTLDAAAKPWDAAQAGTTDAAAQPAAAAAAAERRC
ncbi:MULTISPECIES: hypothetical protein [Burkholderia]|uniref:hypothetical protein n=1 Tax=Burkholderia TaxID=32008 RepID=UPI00080BD23D|nr:MULTISPECIES: hypothetical protein [Burkholderia]MCA8478590.1 hypothetical protein [Burkholderia multivorans]MDR9050793.1 hypothetical protein [Burkholderia multivorans]MDR9057633.1 hypothetical protein [Burkholderia multivorans]MDR9066260.1 hypothetical protein [Burkholderia multivorans]MDR9068438.1 hypothetical protein [Burkholderia multivorans]